MSFCDVVAHKHTNENGAVARICSISFLGYMCVDYCDGTSLCMAYVKYANAHTHTHPGHQPIDVHVSCTT